MIVKTMKRAAVLAAALVLPGATRAARAPSPGEPVKLADTELDRVTAGGTMPLLDGLLDTAGQGLSGSLWLGPIDITTGANVSPGTNGDPKTMMPLRPTVMNIDRFLLGPPAAH
jgi:hypothetical protein